VSLPAISVEGLWVVIGGAALLEDVSFTVAGGQQLAVVGPNGAGKSTLMRCLDGLETAARGTIRIAGRPLGSFTRRQLARELSYVPQRHPEPLPFSVTAFVEMGRYPYLKTWGGLDAEDVAAVRRALDVTETGHLAERAIDSLSGGERQRVLIAAALAQGGSILLLDEPTTALDYRHQVQVMALLTRLRRDSGLTVVVVTHDLNAVAAGADAVLALRDGRVVRSGTAKDLFTGDALASVYGTDFVLVPDPRRDLPLVLPRGAES